MSHSGVDSIKPSLRPCRLSGDAESMQELYRFGRVPVAGYLEPTEELARHAPRFNLSLAISRKSSLVQQANDDGCEMLIRRVYSNYHPTYSKSDHLASYLDTFLEKAVAFAAAQSGESALEIGANDGQVLKLLKQRGLDPIGFEPAANLAAVTRQQDLKVIEEFFCLESARHFIDKYPPVRLVVTRHTLEHAFDPLDFLRGIEFVLAKNGAAVIEIPYLRLQMMNGHFEAMTFQHVTFFSVSTIQEALRMAGLYLEAVTFVNMDGGSMVLYVRKIESGSVMLPNVEYVLKFERFLELDQPTGYELFFRRVQFIRSHVKPYLHLLVQEGNKVAGYGAGSKGQSLLNMLDLDTQEVEFVIDDIPSNVGQYIPGTGIPVIASRDPRAREVDVILLTAPTHIQEIMRKESWRLATGTRFLATVPDFHQVTIRH